jgi:hypothetical protein
MIGYPSTVSRLSVPLIFVLAAGCASTPKPVKCDGHLEPINKPAPPTNSKLLPASSPPALSQSPAKPAVSDRP